MAGIRPEDLACLAPDDGYREAPLPQPRDLDIVSLLQRAGDDGRLDRVREAVGPDEEAAVLRCFGADVEDVPAPHVASERSSVAGRS